MAREVLYWGKTIEQLKSLPDEDIMKLYPSRARRSLARGSYHSQKVLAVKIELAKGDLKNNKRQRKVRTHCRETVIMPSMLDVTIDVHNGKEFRSIIIVPDMLGMRLGELVLTRRRINHGSAGIGATGGSRNQSKK